MLSSGKYIEYFYKSKQGICLIIWISNIDFTHFLQNISLYVIYFTVFKQCGIVNIHNLWRGSEKYDFHKVPSTSLADL